MPAHVFLAALLLTVPGAALAQGVTPYDTYDTPYGTSDYTTDLTPLPDDTDLLGSLPADPDPWTTRTRPARDFGEIADIDADFWEWHADRLRQIRGDIERLDRERLRDDAARGLSLEPSPSLPGRDPLGPAGTGPAQR